MQQYSSYVVIKPSYHRTLKHYSLPCLEPLYDCLENCCGWAKQRYLVACMTGLGTTIAYMQRICLSIMVAGMVKKHTAAKTADSCKPYYGSFMAQPPRKAAFDWSVQLQGEIIASFFYGYFITQIPGGIISDLFGGKHIFGVTVILSSVCTALAPVCAKAGPYYLLITRLAMGIIQGPMFPSITTIVAHWSPPEEMGLMNTIVNSGVPVGLILGNLLTGQILYLVDGWEWPFYIYAVFGAVWYLFWLVLVAPSPLTHPFITIEERNYIIESMHLSSKEPDAKIPWMEMFKSKEFIVATIANLGHETVIFLIATELPIYMFTVLRLPTGMNGLLCSIPWFWMWVGNLFFGELSTLLIKYKIMETLTLRRFFGAIANFVPSLCFALVMFQGCDYISVTVLISIGTFFISSIFISIRASFLDIAPNYAGISISIAACMAALMGFAVPTFVHSLIGDGTRVDDWKLSFFIINGFVAASTIPYLIFIKAEVLPWNEGRVKQKATP